MMDCTRLHELLDAYLAGRLGAAQAADVEAHVAGCAECADVVGLLAPDAGAPMRDELVVRPVLAATTGRRFGPCSTPS